MAKRTFTVGFPFCGLGGGALGFLAAEVRLLGNVGRFVSLGGIDNDDASCRDFVSLTDSPALCADIETMTPAQLREFWSTAPDVVFLSPPCKGFSGLLSKANSASEKYQRMNRLALRCIELLVSTWSTPPRLILLENVPRIATRGAPLLREFRRILRSAGYLLQAQSHDCGELGGLAQHRRRFLLVARHAGRVPSLLYQPIRKRVRGCGEVLGQLPIPTSPGAAAWGKLHELPRLSWINWVRLAIIPAGGDWRDLDGVLKDGQPRREVFRRHHVEEWNAPCATVGGPGSNGPSAVADPRIGLDHTPRRGTMGITSWDESAPAVTGQSGRVGHCSVGAVADPRLAEQLRVRVAYDHGYGVLRWEEPSPTVAGGSHPGQGAYAVSDLRLKCKPWETSGAYGVLRWDDAIGTVTGSAQLDNGTFAVSDPRRPASVGEVPIIIAADETWHRPLTTLELAALQGLPTIVRGEPIRLVGDSVSAWRERIGNAVPPPTAQAIAERMLAALLEADAGAISLSGNHDVWVEPNRAEVC